MELNKERIRRNTMRDIMEAFTRQIVLNDSGINKTSGEMMNIGLKEAYKIVNDMMIEENMAQTIETLESAAKNEINK